MKRRVNRLLVMLLITSCFPLRASANDSFHGPLRVHEGNPRYFTDETGKAVYLVGSHTWNNLSDMGRSDPPEEFNFHAYLTFLERHHHNFIRLWRWESTSWDLKPSAAYTNNKGTLNVAPHPWARVGTDKARDGKPKFDLDKFSPEYFDRLRQRVEAAGNRGIYVSIMLFEGWALQHSKADWENHPFHRDNNVNGIDGDPNADGLGTETHTLDIPEVTRLHEAYVRKVIDTVNDLDNVLYEIANETGAYSTEWQHHLVNYIHEVERSRAKQHPVGMTFQYSPEARWRGSNQLLYKSPADWISPNSDAPRRFNFRSNPPPADGNKIIISDTDHLWGIGGDVDWVWKSFTGGHNLLFMDPYDNAVLGKTDADSWEPLRANLGHARRIAERSNLIEMKPMGELASTGYCLAEPNQSYVVYVPEGGRVTLNLTDARGSFEVEWLSPKTGAITHADSAEGGANRSLSASTSGPVVLIVSKKSDGN